MIAFIRTQNRALKIELEKGKYDGILLIVNVGYELRTHLLVPMRSSITTSENI